MATWWQLQLTIVFYKVNTSRRVFTLTCKRSVSVPWAYVVCIGSHRLIKRYDQWQLVRLQTWESQKASVFLVTLPANNVRATVAHYHESFLWRYRRITWEILRHTITHWQTEFKPIILRIIKFWSNTTRSNAHDGPSFNRHCCTGYAAPFAKSRGFSWPDSHSVRIEPETKISDIVGRKHSTLPAITSSVCGRTRGA